MIPIAAEVFRWTGGALAMLDQRALPHLVEYQTCRSWQDVAQAIAQMTVRGAPAIGVAAAYGIALAALAAANDPGGAAAASEVGDPMAELRRAGAGLVAARPTAVNLKWAVDRQLRTASALGAPNSTARPATGADLATALVAEAQAIHRETEAADRQLAALGAPLLPKNARIYTHCNTGALATGGWGTALGVIRSAHAAGRAAHVWVGETRPRLQGARLTAWELSQAAIPATIVTDGMAAALMAQGRVDAAIVGADRIAANGDTANKIGTYSLAVLCRHHGIPFYVAAPWSTVDLTAASGADIPIEERDPTEVTTIAGVHVAAPGVPAWNPAFDVTPAALVHAIMTERGVVRPPYDESLASLAPAPLPPGDARAAGPRR